MPRHQLSVNFTKDFNVKNEKLTAVFKHLKRELPCLTEDDLFDLYMIYNELITNAIIYGRKRDGLKMAELMVGFDDEDLAPSKLGEEDGVELVSTIRANSLTEIFPENERGIQVVLHFADGFERNAAGTELTFRKYFAG